MKVYLFHLYRFQIELFHREKVIGVWQGGVASSDDDGEGGDKEEDGEGGVGGGDKEIGERHPEWDWAAPMGGARVQPLTVGSGWLQPELEKWEPGKNNNQENQNRIDIKRSTSFGRKQIYKWIRETLHITAMAPKKGGKYKYNVFTGCCTDQKVIQQQKFFVRLFSFLCCKRTEANNNRDIKHW